MTLIAKVSRVCDHDKACRLGCPQSVHDLRLRQSLQIGLLAKCPCLVITTKLADWIARKVSMTCDHDKACRLDCSQRVHVLWSWQSLQTGFVAKCPCLGITTKLADWIARKVSMSCDHDKACRLDCSQSVHVLRSRQSLQTGLLAKCPCLAITTKLADWIARKVSMTCDHDKACRLDCSQSVHVLRSRQSLQTGLLAKCPCLAITTKLADWIARKVSMSCDHDKACRLDCSQSVHALRSRQSLQIGLLAKRFQLMDWCCPSDVDILVYLCISVLIFALPYRLDRFLVQTWFYECITQVLMTNV